MIVGRKDRQAGILSIQWVRSSRKDRGQVETVELLSSNLSVSSSVSITVTEKATTSDSGKLLEITENEEDAIILKDVSEEEAEQHIREYIDEKMDVGDSIFPSDIADALQLDFRQVYRIVKRLIAEGKVAWRK